MQLIYTRIRPNVWRNNLCNSFCTFLQDLG